MGKLNKPVTKVQTVDMPYGLSGDTLLWLPLVPDANATKAGDIVAELDNGYLIVPDKNMSAISVTFVPKGKVQL